MRGGRRRMPWAGWASQEPRGHQRTIMARDCKPYSKCFLGPRKSFPVCKKYTCDVSKKGLWAAYIRARQWGQPRSSYRGKARPTHKRYVYTRVANRAREMLRRRGSDPGWHGGGKKWRRCPAGTKRKLVGQRRARNGRITRHGRMKCVRRPGRTQRRRWGRW